MPFRDQKNPTFCTAFDSLTFGTRSVELSPPVLSGTSLEQVTSMRTCPTDIKNRSAKGIITDMKSTVIEELYPMATGGETPRPGVR